MTSSAAALALYAAAATAWTPATTRVIAPPPPCHQHRSTLLRMEFGDNCYEGALEPLPANVFEVSIERPLGIGFEEDGPIVSKSGVSVNAIVDGSNSAKGTTVLKNVDGRNQAAPGKVEIGDKLIGVTAIRYVGSKWERELFNCRKWSFDTVVEAIGSNEAKFISDYVILQFERPADKSDASAAREVV